MHTDNQHNKFHIIASILDWVMNKLLTTRTIGKNNFFKNWKGDWRKANMNKRLLYTIHYLIEKKNTTF